MNNKLLLLLFLLLLIFVLINNYLDVQENMSMRSNYLNRKLNEKGYKTDLKNYAILDQNNNIIKKYSTLYFNSNKSHYTAKNKPLTNEILMNNKIPTPKHIIITNENKNNFVDASEYFPCVLKPVDGMQGKDVYTHIDNQVEFDKILTNLLQKYDKIMLENLVSGNNFRIFVFNNKVMDIIEREKPYIIGDGIKTVQELIDEKNSDLRKNNLFEVKYLDEKLIKSYGYNLNDVVRVENKVFITNIVNFHNGANAKRIPLTNISNENIKLFEKAHQVIGLECSGVDYMSDDLSIPYYENNGHIIEMNDMVDTKIHIDADEKNNSDLLFDNIINSL